MIARTFPCHGPSLGIAGLGLLTLAACDDGGTGPGCQSHGDCAPERLCRAGSCVLPGAEPEFGIELRPPRSSGLAAEQIRVLASEALVLEMSQPVVLDVEVQAPSENPIRADVDFVRTGADGLPGRPLRVHLDHVPAELRGTAGPPPPVRISSGPHRVRVTPSTGTPIHEPAVRTFRPTPDAQTLLLRIPEYVRVEGRVVSSLQANDPVEGARVLVRGTSSGAVSEDQDTLSSGDFSLRLPATEDPSFDVFVFPPGPGPSWTFRRRFSVAELLAQRPELRLEPTRADLVTGIGIEVVGKQSCTQPELEALVAAEVTLTSTTSRPELRDRVHSVFGVTDADGRLRVTSSTTVPLLEGRYVAQVRPRSGSPALPTDVILLAGGAPAQIRLEQLRTAVDFDVVTADGNVVPDALVEAHPLDSDRPPTTARTDFRGRVTMALDPGPWVFVARPSGRAPGLMVQQVEAAPCPPKSLPALTLPDTAVSEGVVLGPRDRDGVRSPVPGVEVEWFALYGSRSISVAIDLTDSAGRFRARLPATLPAEVTVDASPAE